MRPLVLPARLCGVFIVIRVAAGPAPDQPIYRNPEASIDARIENLLSRMTLEEKVGQLNIPPSGD